MSIGVNIKDLLSPAMRKVLSGVRDPKPMLKAAGAALAGMATRAFRDESVRPAEWPALSQATLKRKGSKGNLLIDSGALRASIVAMEPRGSSVEVGTDRPYAGYLQGGTKRKDGSTRMPARPFMPWDDEGKLTAAAEQAVREALEARLSAMAR